MSLTLIKEDHKHHHAKSTVDQWVIICNLSRKILKTLE